MMGECRNCGVEIQDTDIDKCGVCVERRGIPDAKRIKEAVRDLPEGWFTYKEAVRSLPYYYSYTVNILSILKSMKIVEVKEGGTVKQFKLKEKAVKFIKNEYGRNDDTLTIDKAAMVGLGMGASTNLSYRSKGGV